MFACKAEYAEVGSTFDVCKICFSHNKDTKLCKLLLFLFDPPFDSPFGPLFDPSFDPLFGPSFDSLFDPSFDPLFDPSFV